jgi:Secretion system C-terminal sorting domain
LDISNKKQTNNQIQLSTINLSKQIIGLSEVVVTGDSYSRVVGYSIGVSSIHYSFSDSLRNFFNSGPIKAFPNPVDLGSSLQLNFGNSRPGVYQIRLLNSAGQLFFSSQKQISSKNETEQIHLSEKMSAGVYLVQVIDEKKKLVQTSKIIVQ